MFWTTQFRGEGKNGEFWVFHISVPYVTFYWNLTRGFGVSTHHIQIDRLLLVWR